MEASFKAFETGFYLGFDKFSHFEAYLQFHV